uniref:Uncharacterized protein n=1 Tax=Oryza brachyantha TaxID=4533 RepID=J3N635_ORYBR
MVPEGWHKYSLPAFLLEEHKDEPVDAYVWLRALVAYDLPSLNQKVRQFVVYSKEANE